MVPKASNSEGLRAVRRRRSIAGTPGAQDEGAIDVALKRAYEPAEAKDGYRVFVERLWPRGVRREQLAVVEWCKDLAPSGELRSFFGHDVKRWPEFVHRYRAELALPLPGAELQRLANRATSGRVTLVYAASDREHNSAVVLRDAIYAVQAKNKKRIKDGRGRDRRRDREEERGPRLLPRSIPSP